MEDQRAWYITAIRREFSVKMNQTGWPIVRFVPTT
jgi:hypothetical protein